MNEEEKSDVPSVEAAARILDFLSRYKHKRSTLTEICQKLGLNKSTCLRILRVLKKYQFVSYDEETKKYGLGVYLVVLGARAAEFSDHLEIVRPYLRRLMEETQLTSVLLQPASDHRLMYVLKEEPDVGIRVNVTLGQYFPVTTTSFGKCYLAFMDKTKLDQIIKEVGIRQFTPKTITNVDELRENLKQVVRRGYAVSYEEHTPGVVGIAAPIFDLNGRVSMIIACLGVAAYVDEEKITAYGEKVKEIALEITKALGGQKAQDQ
ncbi:MAG: IclR family transcriptional regulator [Armatimonadetes bacterium]|nr:IclR family transcriptional regulator [Armatimonadota bacterium]